MSTTIAILAADFAAYDAITGHAQNSTRQHDARGKEPSRDL